jgi:hypothetical protein
MESGPRSGWLDDAHYEAWQDHARDVWLRGFLAGAFNFAFCKSELLGLKVQQVDFKDRTIQLLPGTTKHDKGRTVRITEDVFQRLAPSVKDKNADDALLLGETAVQCGTFESLGARCARGAKVPIL